MKLIKKMYCLTAIVFQGSIPVSHMPGKCRVNPTDNGPMYHSDTNFYLE